MQYCTTADNVYQLPILDQHQCHDLCADQYFVRSSFFNLVPGSRAEAACGRGCHADPSMTLSPVLRLTPQGVGALGANLRAFGHQVICV